LKFGLTKIFHQTITKKRLKKLFTAPQLLFPFLKRKLLGLFYFFKYWLLRVKTTDNKLTKTIQGSQMSLNLNDNGIQKDLALKDIREPTTTKAYQRELRKLKKDNGKIIMCDIGANVGYWSLMTLNILEDSGFVIAIEPEKNNVETLRNNISLNNYADQTQIYEYAVSNSAGKSKMYSSTHSNLHTLQTESAKENLHNDMFTVTIKPLSEIIRAENLQPNEVDVIRLDVQGHEAKIFQGMEEIITNNSRLLINLETHLGYMSKKEVNYLVDLLEASNFEIISSVDPLIERKLGFKNIEDIRQQSAELILRRRQN